MNLTLAGVWGSSLKFRGSRRWVDPEEVERSHMTGTRMDLPAPFVPVPFRHRHIWSAIHDCARPLLSPLEPNLLSRTAAVFLRSLGRTGFLTDRRHLFYYRGCI